MVTVGILIKLTLLLGNICSTQACLLTAEYLASKSITWAAVNHRRRYYHARSRLHVEWRFMLSKGYRYIDRDARRGWECELKEPVCVSSTWPQGWWHWTRMGEGDEWATGKFWLSKMVGMDIHLHTAANNYLRWLNIHQRSSKVSTYND